MTKKDEQRFAEIGQFILDHPELDNIQDKQALAELYWKARQYEKAILCYKTAIGNGELGAEERAKLNHKLAQLYVRMGDPYQAEPFFLTAIELMPDDEKADLYRELALSYSDAEVSEKADAYMREAIQRQL